MGTPENPTLIIKALTLGVQGARGEGLELKMLSSFTVHGEGLQSFNELGREY